MKKKLFYLIGYIYFLSLQLQFNYFYSNNSIFDMVYFILDLIVSCVTLILIYYVLGKKKIYLNIKVYILILIMVGLIVIFTYPNFKINNIYYKIVYIIKYSIILCTFRVKKFKRS